MPYSDYKCFRFRFDAGVAFVKVDPLLKPLRKDPRWSALVTKLGLDG